MKILIVNKSASGGGAAVAAQRLYSALKEYGANVNMLVQDFAENNTGIHSLSTSSQEKRKNYSKFIKERLFFLPYEKNKSVRFAFSPAVSGIDISNHPLVKEADIIHLHWINHGFLSLNDLNSLFRLNKKIVWTLHDMWPFSGGCHYAGECNHYIENCGDCKFLRRPGPTDLSNKLLLQKSNIWYNAKIHPVACSKWLGSLAAESTLFRRNKITSIPNPINTDLFKPLDSFNCRRKLGLPTDKKLLLFGAANLADPRKGSGYLTEALQHLEIKHPELIGQMELVMFGKSKNIDLKKYPFKVHQLSFISDVDQMVDIYNSAEAFVLPSLQDNLPNTVMESLACGVPVISFSVGGVPEMISHRKTGFLATTKNSESLANGIYEILMSPDMPILKENARQAALINYSNQVIAKKYMELYQSI